MSPRKSEENEPETSKMNDTPDGDDPRVFEHDDAEEVRQGNMSAAQMSGGGGGVDPEEPDAQYPPGRVESMTAPAAPAAADLAGFVPEKRNAQRDVPTYQTTSEAPFGSA